MTPEEAKEKINEVIKIKAEGLVQGYKEVKITYVDSHEQTPWGRGTVLFENISDGRPVKMALHQVELYNNSKEEKRRGNNKKRRKRKNVEKN